MKFITISILLIFLLFGCVNLSYLQTVQADGSGTLTQSIDLTSYVEFVKNTAPTELNDSTISSFCTTMRENLTSGTECAVRGNTILLTRKVTQNDGFYSFESSGDFLNPYYKVVVHRIPATAFFTSVPNQSTGAVTDIDLSQKDVNQLSAQTLTLIGVGMNYTITMPLTVTSARAGNYSAVKSGNRATFDLLKVFESSENLVIEAQEFNTLLVIGMVITAIIVFLLLWLFVAKPARTR